MFGVDSECKAFLESNLSIIVGTSDLQLSPQVCRGWGPRVLPDRRTIELFLDRLPALRTVANLRENPSIAVTLSSPVTYRTIQFKGRCLEISEPDAADAAWIARHRSAFAVAVEAFGTPPYLTARLWTTEVTKVRFQIETAYDQTPGPARGRELEPPIS